jgi:hypothetical protein
MSFETFFVLVLKLAQGILAVQAPHAPVQPQEALVWATAAAIHATRGGLDPFELVGIARNETDFRTNLVGPDGLDCGITQTRVIYSKFKCRQLRADARLGFQEAARELVETQRRCERRAKHDLTRCRLNSYNQGVRYRKTGRAGAYWLRVLCYAEAARAGVTPQGDCRRVTSRRQIERLIAEAKPPKPSPALERLSMAQRVVDLARR